MTEQDSNDGVLARLTEVVESERCIAFVGAGLSKPAYDDWRLLVESLCVACTPEGGETGGTRPSFMKLAERAKEADPQKYEAVLRKKFVRKPPQPKHKILAKVPFAAYVTTNYDSMINQALSEVYHSNILVYPFPYLPANKLDQAHAVFHLHGIIVTEKPLMVVLAESEYKKAYNDLPCIKGLLGQMIYRPVCFLGCSLDDEYLQPALEECDRLRKTCEGVSGRQAPEWFILKDSDETDTGAAKKFGISVVPYDRQTDDHKGLTEILKNWVPTRRPILQEPFDGNVFLPEQEPRRR